MREYAKEYIWGIDFAEEISKTSRALMLIAGDGRSHMFKLNSLDPREWQGEDALLLTARAELQERLTSQNFSLGLNVIFSFGLVISLFFVLYHLLLGLGLLKGKAAAWYVQIVTAIFSLILIPYGTVVSIVILIFFFQSNVRNFFKV